MEYAHTTKRFLSFGEVLWDIIDNQPYIGGAPFNVAAHLANCGADSFMLSRLGKDDLGDRAFAQIEGLKVNTSLIQRDDVFPTGTVEVFIDNGQPDYTINEHVAYDYIRADGIPPLSDIDFDCLYFGTLAQRNSVSRDTLHWVLANLKFKTVFYDVNLRKGVVSESLILPSLGYCDIFKLNNEEVDVLSMLIYHKRLSNEDFVHETSRAFNIDVIIITAAEKGCYIFHDDVLTFVPGEKVQLQDGVGAGDAFSAAFLFYFSQYKNAVKSAQIANKLGAFVASCRGAIPVYSPEIRAHLDNARLEVG